ncbi:MAG: hypothetical protein WCO42_08970 [bacterium]
MIANKTHVSTLLAMTLWGTGLLSGREIFLHRHETGELAAWIAPGDIHIIAS